MRAHSASARSLIQEIVTGVKQSNVEDIRRSIANPLIFHNLVVYNGHLLRSALKEKKGIASLTQRFFLKHKLKVFSHQVFERYFNSNDRRELIELKRNFRVLEFFVDDCFVYHFDKRPNWHVLYEDVFFQTISDREAKAIGTLHEALFQWYLSQEHITDESLRLAIPKIIRLN